MSLWKSYIRRDIENRMFSWNWPECWRKHQVLESLKEKVAMFRFEWDMWGGHMTDFIHKMLEKRYFLFISSLTCSKKTKKQWLEDKKKLHPKVSNVITSGTEDHMQNWVSNNYFKQVEVLSKIFLKIFYTYIPKLCAVEA